MFTQQEAVELLEGDGVYPFPSLYGKLFFSFSYYSGLSVEHVRLLKWMDIDMDKGIIQKDEKEVDISPELRNVIDKITYDSLWTRKADYLFPDSEGNAPTPASVNELFIETMTHAGINYLARKLTPNSFRRTFNFWFA